MTIYAYFIARVAMNLTSLLTFIAMSSGVRSEMPKVSYISFMGLWIKACVLMIFFATGEFGLSHALCRKKSTQKAIELDRKSRHTMMWLFILFNAIYWPMLLNNCNSFQKD